MRALLLLLAFTVAHAGFTDFVLTDALNVFLSQPPPLTRNTPTDGALCSVMRDQNAVVYSFIAETVAATFTGDNYNPADSRNELARLYRNSHMMWVMPILVFSFIQFLTKFSLFACSNNSSECVCCNGCTIGHAGDIFVALPYVRGTVFFIVGLANWIYIQSFNGNMANALYAQQNPGLVLLNLLAMLTMVIGLADIIFACQTMRTHATPDAVSSAFCNLFSPGKYSSLGSTTGSGIGSTTAVSEKSLNPVASTMNVNAWAVYYFLVALVEIVFAWYTIDPTQSQTGAIRVSIMHSVGGFLMIVPAFLVLFFAGRLNMCMCAGDGCCGGCCASKGLRTAYAHGWLAEWSLFNTVAAAFMSLPQQEQVMVLFLWECAQHAWTYWLFVAFMVVSFIMLGLMIVLAIAVAILADKGEEFE
jgi:hypothetical protein